MYECLCIHVKNEKKITALPLNFNSSLSKLSWTDNKLREGAQQSGSDAHYLMHHLLLLL